MSSGSVRSSPLSASTKTRQVGPPVGRVTSEAGIRKSREFSARKLRAAASETAGAAFERRPKRLSGAPEMRFHVTAGVSGALEANADQTSRISEAGLASGSRALGLLGRRDSDLASWAAAGVDAASRTKSAERRMNRDRNGTRSGTDGFMASLRTVGNSDTSGTLLPVLR